MFFTKFFTIVNNSVQLCRTPDTQQYCSTTLTTITNVFIKIFCAGDISNPHCLNISCMRNPRYTETFDKSIGLFLLRVSGVNSVNKPTPRGEIWRRKPSVPLLSPQLHPSLVKTEFMSGINETKFWVN